MLRKSFLVAGLFAAALVAVPPAEGQQSAPRVRLATLPTTGPGRIAPSISLSEPAYLFVVAIDSDGQIEVLSPAMPSEAIRFEAGKSIRLPEFFPGFRSVSSYGGYRSRYSRSSFADYSNVAATNGSVLVVASRTPFSYATISDGEQWNDQALLQIVRYRTPREAATALGRALTGKGQSFGHDYVYLGRSAHSQLARYSFMGDCIGDDPSSPFRYSSYYGVSGFSYNGLVLAGYGNRSGLRLIQVGTDGCGRARYMLMPVRIIPPPSDSNKIDSVKKADFRTVVAGTYTGDEARRVYENLVSSKNSSGTDVGLGSSPVYSEKEDKMRGRPVSREEQSGQVESYEKVRSSGDHPINRGPVNREPQDNTPVMRAQPVERPAPISREPVMNSAPAVQREPKPVEVVVKDN